MKDGAAPRAPGQIALDSKTAERTGYKVGDTVRMSVDGPVRTEKVTGIYTTEDGNVAAAWQPRPLRQHHGPEAVRQAR